MPVQSVLFHRSYDRYSGGHQKVRDYFEHFRSHPGYSPRIFFSGGVGTDGLWTGLSGHIAPAYEPRRADINFLAGIDWQHYLQRPASRSTPVINLIQHVRHADPASDVFPFLAEKAIRVCVSPEVEAAISQTRVVNGPVYTIPNGINLAQLENYAELEKASDIYILGNKQPLLATSLSEQLRDIGLSVIVHAEHTSRHLVLSSMAASDVVVLLPHETEGFYLPALEAMALSDMVVVPDCVGNRSFCKDGENCLMPALEREALLASTQQALSLVESGAALSFGQKGQETLACHSLERERLAFYDILDNLEQIW